MTDTLVDRLRGVYRIPINDGLGPVGAGDEPDNPKEFVRHFEPTTINREAADRIEALQAALANAEERAKRNGEMLMAEINHGTEYLNKIIELERALAFYEGSIKVTPAAKEATDDT